MSINLMISRNLILVPRRFFALLFLISGTMAWFFLIGTEITTLLNFQVPQTTIYLGTTFFAATLSTVVGSQLLKKRNKKKFLLLWITSGVLATAVLLATLEPLFQLASLLLVGISWGLGLPYCLSVFANWTSASERARVSGTIILLTFSMVAIALSAIRFLHFNPNQIILLAIVLRSVSFVALLLDPFKAKEDSVPRKEKVLQIIHYRNFVLYLVPWLIFNAAIGLVSFVWSGLQTTDYIIIGETGNLVRFISFAISGFVCGIVADRYGRKPPIILGLVTLGISFTFLGLATLSFNSLVSSAVLVYYVTSGVAWGFLTAVYLAVLGDLPFSREREAVYAVGLILPLLVFVGSSIMPAILGVSAPAHFLSIILSIMLFSSVVPILYASETLPDRDLQKRKMKNYLDKVARIIEEDK